MKEQIYDMIWYSHRIYGVVKHPIGLAFNSVHATDHPLQVLVFIYGYR